MFNGEYLPPEKVQLTDFDLPLMWVDFGLDSFDTHFQSTINWWLKQESIIDFIAKAFKTVHAIRTANSFAGSFFEQVAFLQLLDTTKDPNKIVFSPQYTFELFSKVNSDRISSVLNGFNPAIQGLTCPDLIAFYINSQSIVITDIFECKTGKNVPLHQTTTYSQQNFLERSLKLKQDTTVKTNNATIFLGEIMHQINPNIPLLPVRISENLRKVLVIPSGSDLKLDGFYNYRTDFYRNEYGRFIDLLWSDITKTEPTRWKHCYFLNSSN